MLRWLRAWLIIKRKQWAIRILSGISGSKPAHFIILCQPRTGSSLLHTYLNSHPAIMSYGELVRNGNYLQKAFQPFPGSIKAVGFKLFYVDQSKDVFKRVMEDREVKIIHLVREDLLRQFISLKRAEITGEWSRAKNVTRSTGTMLKLDVNLFRQFEFETLLQRKQMMEIFTNHQVIQISYEALCSDPEAVLTRIQQFLSVRPRHLFSLLKKQNPEQLEQIVLNYSAIKNLREL